MFLASIMARLPRSTKGWLLVFLICSHGALAMREQITVNEHLTRSLSGAQARDRDLEALSKIEELVDSVQHHVREWAKTRPEGEQPSEASFLEMKQHLDRTVLSEGGVASKLNVKEWQEAAETLRTATQRVENINLFLCKRTPIKGYVNTNHYLNPMENRNLKDGSLEVRCSNKVNILNHGVVGNSVTGKDKKAMAEAIDNLKAMTEDNKYSGKAFPIKLKMCTRADGNCQAGDKTTTGTDFELIQSEDEIFGGGLTETIPIPEHLKKYLSRVKHNEDHPFAICFDDQDDCSGMMWVPKNLHTCSGWFTGKDTRVTLGQLRDAVTSNAWSRWWTQSGKERLSASLGFSKDQLPKDEQAEMELVEEVQANVQAKSCPVKEWKEQEAASSRENNEESLQQLRKVTSIYYERNQHVQAVYHEVTEAEEKLKLDLQRVQETYNQWRSNEDQSFVAEVEQKLTAAKTALSNFETTTKRSKLEAVDPLKLEMQARKREAYNICVEAEKAGEGVDCDGNDRVCVDLGHECAKMLRRSMNTAPCRTKLEMAELLKTPQAVHAPEDRAVANDHRRRRRAGSGIMDILFPPYYYHHTPYCYPWYGGYGGGFYAYPMVPNVGGNTFGFGTFDPGIMMIEGMGHIGLHMAEGMMHVGGAIADGLGGTGGGGEGFQCDGDICGLIVIGIIIFILIVLIIWAIYKLCKPEENCHTPWYRGGRLSKKVSNWIQTWDGIEQHVYGMGGSLMFDGVMAIDKKQDRCMSKLQWGRKWVRQDDHWDKHQPGTTNLELEGKLKQ